MSRGRIKIVILNNADTTLKGLMTSRKTTSHRLPKWRYVVLLGKFSNHFLQQGIMKSMGVLIPSLVVQLNISYATVGFLLSLQITMNYMACPLVQLLLRKFDARKTATLGGLGTGLCVICVAFFMSVPAVGTFFFLAGVCSSTLCQASFVVLRHYFGDHFGTANSISYLGSLVGGMTIPFLTNLLHEAYGLRGTLLCIGGLFLNSVPIGAIFKLPRAQSTASTPNSDPLIKRQDDEEQEEQEEDEDRGESKDNSDQTKPKSCCINFLQYLTIAFDIKALRNEPSFTIFFLPCQIILDIVFIGWALFMVSYAIDVGFSSSLAVYLPIAAASGGFVSRTTLAIAMHYRPRWSPELYAMDVAISGVSLVLYPLHSHLSHLIVCSFFAGYGLYGAASTYYAVIAVTVSEANFPGIIAISFFISGIGAMLSGLLAGIIYDATKSFLVVFRIFGIMMGAIFILVNVHLFLHCYRKKHNTKTDE